VKMAFTALSGSFMPVWAAQDAGLFTGNGVDLELSYIGNSPTAMAGLLAGEVDMLVGAPDAGNAAAVDGADVVQVASLLNKIVQAIYAAPTYTDPNSLRGHSVGITRFGALSDSAVRYLLRRWNLEPERDVSLRQIGGFPEMVAALSAGGIEAGILAPPHTLRAKDLGFVELGNLWTQPLEYPAIVFTARKQRSAEADEKVRRVLRASAEGIHRVKNDRATAMKTLETYAQSDDARANDEAYEIYTPLFERDLRLSREAFKTALEELVRNKPQAASFDADALMDARFVEELRGSGLIQRLYGS
jgi:NitT/TauT family transport system substrate-binding protein